MHTIIVLNDELKIQWFNLPQRTWKDSTPGWVEILGRIGGTALPLVACLYERPRASYARCISLTPGDWVLTGTLGVCCTTVNENLKIFSF